MERILQKRKEERAKREKFLNEALAKYKINFWNVFVDENVADGWGDERIICQPMFTLEALDK